MMTYGQEIIFLPDSVSMFQRGGESDHGQRRRRFCHAVWLYPYAADDAQRTVPNKVSWGTIIKLFRKRAMWTWKHTEDMREQTAMLILRRAG